MVEAIKALLDEIKRLQETTFSYCPVSSAVSSWVHLRKDVRETVTYERAKEWRCGVEYAIRGKPTRILKGQGQDLKKKVAYEKACVKMLEGIPRVQEDVPVNEPPQGEEKLGEVASAGTTIMMNDAEEAVEVTRKEVSQLQRLMATTEPLVDFSSNPVTNRWFPMDQFAIKASDTYLDEPLKVYNIPEFLYTANANADACGNGTQINLLPLRGFIYGDLELEFKMMVTAAPFQVGRLMLSVIPVPMGLKTQERIMGEFYELNEPTGTSFHKEFVDVVNSYSGVSVSTTRPNVIVDIADSTTGSITTKFLFNRPFVRVLDGSFAPVNRGVRGAWIYSLLIHSVTPIRVGPEQPDTIQVKLYYRFTKMQLTGLTKQHALMAKTQMDILPLIGEGLKIINGVERTLTRAGVRTSNRDKPNDVFKFETIIPRPRAHFPNGKGIGDCTIMAVDVTTLSTHFEETMEPDNWITYAQLPGLYQRNALTTSQKANDVVYETIAVPLAKPRELLFPEDASGSIHHAQYNPPVDIAAGHFMFFSGTIVYRFDFIKSAYHRLTLLFSISYGKDEGLGDSVYEKIVEIQDRKSVEIRIPYIYDTMVRRTGTPAIHQNIPATDTWGPNVLPMEANTKLTVRIVNPLTEIGSVSSTIDMVVYKYAGEDFSLYAPVQSVTELFPNVENSLEQGFPSFKAPITDADVGGHLDYFQFYPILQPGKVVHKPFRATVQIDEKEFSTGPVIPVRLNTDLAAVRYKDLLRKPVLVAERLLGGNQILSLPILPPSRDLCYYFQSPALAWSHQAHITTQYTMWRGDIEITLVVDGPFGTIVNVTYLPPDGICRTILRAKEEYRTFGATDTLQNVGPALPGNNSIPLASTGCMTSLLIPAVNPTEKYNIPYNSPYSYLYLNRVCQSNKLNTFRDITSMNNGTLQVTTTKNCTIQVYYNVGDTFELAGFIGHPPIITSQTYAHSDGYRMLRDVPLTPYPLSKVNAPKGGKAPSAGFPASSLLRNQKATVQMEDVVGTITSVVPLASAVASFIMPAEYQAALTTVTLAAGATRLARSCSKFDTSAEKVSTLAESTTQSVKAFTQNGDPIAQLIETVIPEVQDTGVVSAVYTICSEVLHCCLAKDWKGMALGIFNILRTLGLATQRLISMAIGKVVGLFRVQATVQSGEFNLGKFFQMVLTLSCTAIYTTMFVTSPPEGFVKAKTKRLMNMLSYFKGLSIVGGGVMFLTRFIEACITFAQGLIVDKDPQAKVLQQFAGKDEFLNSFIDEALFYLDERNSKQGFLQPSIKARFWLCTLNAYQISGMLYKMTHFQPAMRPLLDLCNKVIKKSNEHLQDFEKSIVKYVPYLIHICGEPRIGKSFVADKIVAIMAQNIGEKIHGMVPAFTFPVGAKWMNLYNGEKFVKMDDFFAMKSKEFQETEASFIMESKSPIAQNVAKPECKDKKEQFDLRGIVAASNCPYPDYTGVLNTPAAADQRFDAVWKVRSNGKEKNETFEHLEFTRLPSLRPDGNTPKFAEEHAVWISAEEFFAILAKEHLEYHKVELKNIQARISIQASTLKKASMLNEYLVDPLTFFYNADQVLKDNVELEKASHATALSQEEQIAMLVNEFSHLKAMKTGVGWTLKPDEEKVVKETVATTQMGESFSFLLSDEACTRCKLPMVRGAFASTCTQGCSLCPSCFSKINKCHHQEALIPSVSKPIRIMYWIWYYTGKISLDILRFMFEHPFRTFMGGMALWQVICGIRTWRRYRQVAWEMAGVTNPFWVAENGGTLEAVTRLMAVDARQQVAIDTLAQTQVDDKPEYTLEDDSECEEMDRPKLSPFRQTLDSSTISSVFSIPSCSAGDNLELRTPSLEDVAEFVTLNITPQNRCVHRTMVKVWEDLKVSFEEGVSRLIYSCVRDKGVFTFTVGKVQFTMPVGSCNCSNWLRKVTGNECLMNTDWSIRFYNSFLDTHRQVLTTALYSDFNMVKFNIPKLYWPSVFRLKDEKLVTAAEELTRQDWLFTLYNTVKDNYVLVLAGVVALYAVVKVMKCSGVFSKVWSLITGLSFSKVQAVVHDSGEQRVSRIRGAKRRRAALVQTAPFYQNIEEKITKNYVVITDGKNRMIGIGIVDDCVLLPKHYYYALIQPKEVTVQFSLTSTHESTVFDTRNFKIVYSEDDDLMLVRLGKKAWFADIRKFFMRDSEYDEFGDDEVDFAYVDRVSMGCEIKTVSILNRLDQHIAVDSRGNNYISYRVLEYNFEEPGACGNILLRRNAIRPVCGMHVSGVRGAKQGQALVTTQEMLAQLLTGQKLRNFAEIQVDLEEPMHDFGEDVNFEYLGGMNKGPYLATKTALQHSLIAEIIDPIDTMQPAILSDQDPRYKHGKSPLHYGVAKHGKPVDSFYHQDVAACRRFWQAILLPSIKPVPGIHEVKVYDVKTAVIGLPNIIDYYDPLPADTSVGYPLTLTGKTKKKDWMEYVRNDQEQAIDVVIHPDILEKLKVNEELRQQGCVAPVIFQDELKDEKRKIDKLMKEGGTRVFSMSPVESSIAHRQYFMDYINALHFSLIDNWHAISINPDSMHWTKLANRLLSVSNNCFSIDFSNFGPGLDIDVAEGFVECANDWYEEYTCDNKLVQCGKENEVRKLLVDELLNSAHIALRTIYRTRSGSPSGGTQTGEINSWVHLNYITLVWRLLQRIQTNKLTPHEKIKLQHVIKYMKAIHKFTKLDFSFEAFLQNVRGVVYGDDGAFAVSEEYKDVFNALVISMVLSAFKITATDASKSATIVPYCPITEIEFLKRRFVLDKEKMRWMAPIAKQTITECARWVREKKALKMATRENAGASLLLAFGHGRIFFDEWREKLNHALTQVGIMPIVWTWDDIEEMAFPTIQSYRKINFDTFYLECREIVKEFLVSE